MYICDFVFSVFCLIFIKNLIIYLQLKPIVHHYFTKEVSLSKHSIGKITCTFNMLCWLHNTCIINTQMRVNHVYIDSNSPTFRMLSMFLKVVKYVHFAIISKTKIRPIYNSICKVKSKVLDCWTITSFSQKKVYLNRTTLFNKKNQLTSSKCLWSVFKRLWCLFVIPTIQYVHRIFGSCMLPKTVYAAEC